MKIAVYAISKNEEKFARRWMKSMREADGIFVADTGSTDNTVKILKEMGATVETRIIDPWRFDKARNESLKLVPDDYDICVCTDLDEIFTEGWRKELEKSWIQGVTTRARYKYVWSFNEDETPGTSFWYEKIHARKGFKWVHPVHEVLARTDGGKDIYTTVYTMRLDHHPDNTKSRGQYLALLEMSVKEEPNDDRNMHYLGREYMFNGQWDKCITTLKKHLEMPQATWADERSASMRYIARAYINKNDLDSAARWQLRAIAEAPYLREGYIEAAQLAYRQENWIKVFYMVIEALKITTRPETYINEAFCWNETVYDLGAIAAYNLGLYDIALEYAQTAYKMNPQNPRLKSNFDYIGKKIELLKEHNA